VFSNSFTGFFVNLLISFFWLAIAISTKQYFLALGSFFFIGFALLVDLADSSTEEGTYSYDPTPAFDTPLLSDVPLATSSAPSGDEVPPTP
jgi:urea transporter